MKKFVQMLLIMCMVVFSAQVAFANADRATVQEGADITAVKRIAVAAPLYMPVSDKAPNKELLTQILSDASRVSHRYVISYDGVAEGIKTATNVDIKSLDRRQAAKVFKENAANYADAYVVLTVANSSRTTFFFDVFKAGTNELLYTYEIRANKSEEDSVATFNNLCEQFYKHLDRSTDDQLKANSKKK
ncbi:hypothetical protein SAMN05216582_12615 [Selenomonas ruminantium]|uniref:Coenzyme F(420) biosynthesis enzyme n=1 Tax=Selenomonas ruminantium TaxID=971 RepID=A0A1M6WKZ8_SELRU|nr:coenzyme F(420) biosynthesis enzyme [Selenomonas ruminantium]SHK94397.1 hypothetical protein SAMN05216582_12615 [Selenomonas ruminantium]